MKLILIVTAVCLSIFAISCKTSAPVESNGLPAPTEAQVLYDFANKVVNPTYRDLNMKMQLLNTSVLELVANSTSGNLEAARIGWLNSRQVWEQSEAFLFGPVEDFNYDPAMDDWPVNHVDLDSLLASSNTLTAVDIDALPTSLKGFHPVEYILFGIGGSKQASQITDREKQYLIALTQNLVNVTATLRESWDPGKSDNFTTKFITAGSGSAIYASRKDAFIAMVAAMAGICDEVSNSKINEPFLAKDSTLEESQFSHNSINDFTNNIAGMMNVYMGSYQEQGRSLYEIVAAKNISLANKIQSQINTSLSAMGKIDRNFGKAIFTHQSQIKETQAALNSLTSLLENELMDFINKNIKD